MKASNYVFFMALLSLGVSSFSGSAVAGHDEAEKAAAGKRQIAQVPQDTWVCRVEYTSVGNSVYFYMTNTASTTLASEEFRGTTKRAARGKCLNAIKFGARYPRDSSCKCNPLF